MKRLQPNQIVSHQQSNNESLKHQRNPQKLIQKELWVYHPPGQEDCDGAFLQQRPHSSCIFFISLLIPGQYKRDFALVSRMQHAESFWS